MKMIPVNFVWNDDGHMVPEPRFAQLCDRQYVIGEIYPLMPLEARSMKMHNFFFAALNEAWSNLNEADAKRFPTAESLRAWALVTCGFYTEKDYVCDDASKAKYLARIIRAHSQYAVIKVSGNVVKVFDAKSQSVAVMGHDEFKDSKEKVLDLVATMARTTRAELAEEATKVAPREKTAKPTPKTTSNPPAGRPLEGSEARSRPALADAPEKPPSEPPMAGPVRSMPVDAAAYFAHARSWIMAATDQDHAWARWDGEREMRDTLRVSIPSREILTKLIEKQFNATEEAR